jgi:hypothetical protein
LKRVVNSAAAADDDDVKFKMSGDCNKGTLSSQVM